MGKARQLSIIKSVNRKKSFWMIVDNENENLLIDGNYERIIIDDGD